MIVFLAFVRTAAVSLLCLFAGVAVYSVIVWLCRQAGIQTTAEAKGWIGSVCLIGAWASYRLFFRQVWRKEGEDWIQE